MENVCGADYLQMAEWRKSRYARDAVSGGFGEVAVYALHGWSELPRKFHGLEGGRGMENVCGADYLQMAEWRKSRYARDAVSGGFGEVAVYALHGWSELPRKFHGLEGG